MNEGKFAPAHVCTLVASFIFVTQIVFYPSTDVILTSALVATEHAFCGMSYERRSALTLDIFNRDAMD